MRIVTAMQMKNIDKAAIEDYGIQEIVLMENAGTTVAKKVEEMLGNIHKVISLLLREQVTMAAMLL